MVVVLLPPGNKREDLRAMPARPGPDLVHRSGLVNMRCVPMGDQPVDDSIIGVIHIYADTL